MNVLVDRKDDKVIYNIIHQYNVKVYKDGVELELTSDTFEITLERSSFNIIIITEISNQQIVDRYEEFLTGADEFQADCVSYLNTPNIVSTTAKMFNNDDKKAYDEGFIEGLLIGSIIDRNF